jgi:hypothetical protein
MSHFGNRIGLTALSFRKYHQAMGRLLLFIIIATGVGSLYSYLYGDRYGVAITNRYHTCRGDIQCANYFRLYDCVVRNLPCTVPAIPVCEANQPCDKNKEILAIKSTDIPRPPIEERALPPLPDLLFTTGQGREAIGRLVFNVKANSYEISDGRVETFVTDPANNGEIRVLRRDEAGGAPTNPIDPHTLHGSIFSIYPGTQVLLRMGSDFSIQKQLRYGSAANNSDRLEIFGSAVVIATGKFLLAFDRNLQKIGELDLSAMGVKATDGVRVGDKLQFFAATVDMTDPRNMRIAAQVKVNETRPPTGTRFSGFDPASNSWLFVDGLGDSQILRVGAFAQASPRELVALTPLAPFYAVFKNSNVLSLASVRLKPTGITIGPMTTVDISSGAGIQLRSRDQRLFILGSNGVRTYDLRRGIEPELSQDFLDEDGRHLLLFKEFGFAEGLESPSAFANKTRLSPLLQMKAIAGVDVLSLKSELGKLNASDSWAVPLLIDFLKTNFALARYRTVILGGLGNLGPAAKQAIPQILDGVMNQAAINRDYLQPMIDALAKIDPNGEFLIPELTLFESRHKHPAAKTVVKAVLAALSAGRAKEAPSAPQNL